MGTHCELEGFSTNWEVHTLVVTCATHVSPTWTRSKGGNRDVKTLLSRPRAFLKGREQGTQNQMAIEEHQAGELGVPRLHNLYTTLKATTAYESQ